MSRFSEIRGSGSNPYQPKYTQMHKSSISKLKKNITNTRKSLSRNKASKKKKIQNKKFETEDSQTKNKFF